ncbi:hypothetical protein GCM10022408_21990 [Hymenobacter fastidiosus]|uniref:DUF3575 domain-containing protein n=1 Tax=Hymenobacter fastidiosus TaxID=486264 RepID=A0ABP7SC45_9BACT
MLAGLGYQAAAQSQVSPATKARGLALKAELTPVLAGGYHLSLEKAWGTSFRHSFSLTPQLYGGPVGELTSTLSEGGHDRVRGFGFAGQYRHYLNPQPQPLAGVYVAGGPHYQRFRLTFQAREWQAEPGPNGLAYYEYRLRDQVETITRFGAAVVVGKQVFLGESPVFLDLYFGMGWRTTRTTTSAPTAGRYASGLSDYGHAGFYLPAGVKLGVAW